MSDQIPNLLVKCVSTDGRIRGVAVRASELIEGAARLHRLDPEGTCRFGEALIAAMIVASYCKRGEQVNLRIQGSGRFHDAFVDASPEGSVRGYLVRRRNPGRGAPEGADQGPWGEGVLSVLRAKEGEGEQPYIGNVPLVTGHLAKDLTYYWFQSEQVPTAVGIAVRCDDGGRVLLAGGFMVQTLGGAGDEAAREIERNIREISSLAEALAQDQDPTVLLSRVFQDMAFMIVENRQVRYECRCSRERVLRALSLVGVDELREMMANKEEAVVRCDFCEKEYRVWDSELKTLISRAAARGDGAGD